jgi:hypothetical protein
MNMPLCIEKKLLLSGGEVSYDCELVRCDADFGVLRHMIDREYTVGGIRLAPGDVTYALYWTRRPYTLYTWQPKRLHGLVFYFNIADTVSLSPQEFRWRDLVVDILIHDGKASVLDKDELPGGIDPLLRRAIQAATQDIVEQHRVMVEELQPFVRELHRRE